MSELNIKCFSILDLSVLESKEALNLLVDLNNSKIDLIKVGYLEE